MITTALIVFAVSGFVGCTSSDDSSVGVFDYGKKTVYYNDGTVMRLGTYPRSEVSLDLASLLESQYPTLETEGEYYRYNGNFYSRVVVHNDYVDEDTSDDKFELFTQYKVGSVHWYLVEPIVWRLMNVQDGYAIFFTDELIDSMAFSDGDFDKDWLWENSDVRAWLNGDFYSKAFSEEEAAYLMLFDSPCYYISNPGRYKYERVSVQDRIRIPEWREMMLPEQFLDDAGRRADVTDYARAHGGLCVTEAALNSLGADLTVYGQYIGSGIYWLIDTEYNSDNIYIVYEYGNVISYKRVVKNRTVRPVIVCRYKNIKNKLSQDAVA